MESQTAGFPPFPTVLGNPATAAGFPHSHSFDDHLLLFSEAGNATALTHSHPGVGQNKLPKWADSRLFRTFGADHRNSNNLDKKCFKLFRQWLLPRAIRKPSCLIQAFSGWNGSSAKTSSFGCLFEFISAPHVPSVESYPVPATAPIAGCSRICRGKVFPSSFG
jgi:hypothetical protein